MKEKLKNILKLFITFLKIGLFTFGGGYAMIGVIQDEVVEKKKWISQDDFFEIIVVSESTPGPVAVNMATYIGYKVAGIWGSVFSTIGLAIPSLVIIYIISLFYKEFLEFAAVKAIFKGLQVGIIVLLLTTVAKLAKQMEKGMQFYIVFFITLVTMICFSIFIPSFSWISIILIGLGLILGSVNVAIAEKKKKDKDGGKTK